MNSASSTVNTSRVFVPVAMLPALVANPVTTRQAARKKTGSRKFGQSEFAADHHTAVTLNLLSCAAFEHAWNTHEQTALSGSPARTHDAAGHPVSLRAQLQSFRTGRDLGLCGAGLPSRSEEHTSELQSQSNLV